MTDEDMIAAMVKSRECCRQLVGAYEQARLEGRVDSSQNVGLLANAEQIVTRMLVHLKELPDRINGVMQAEQNRKYAFRLMMEIGDLLQRALVLEREMRNSSANIPYAGRGPAVLPGGKQVVKAYSW